MKQSSLLSNRNKFESKNPLMHFILTKFHYDLLDVFPKDVSSVLDVGCGEGFTTSFISSNLNLKIKAVDFDSEAIYLAKKKFSEINFSVGDIYCLNEKNKSFDIVCSFEVLEHLNNPEKALNELCRVSSSFVLLSVPREPWFQLANFLRLKYLSSFGNHPGHVNHWTEKDFENFVSSKCKIIEKKVSLFWIIVLAQVY